MNLADAIRRATAQSRAFIEPQEARPASRPQERPRPDAHQAHRTLGTNDTNEPRSSNGAQPVVEPGRPPEPPSPAIAGGNAVRLELFLSGEQMTTMLKAIMAGQHSVLTLREAAAYLRLGSKALERLVEDGEIPALEIDGKYRFPKANLDDWMAMKTATTEEKKDAA
ncbi:MAG: helix-turn-helix domain-containing protein [Armatimonadetes bacterium]|nr:helix-turn-helix domain-containing protein [Armatimonadota bacterium]